MAFGIVFDVDTEGFDESVRKLDGDLKKATAAALNDTVGEVLQVLRNDLIESLDDPTDFTLDAYAATKAKPGNSPAAQIYVKPQQYSYLKYQMEGGVEPGLLLVPGSGADLDEHGNFRPGYIESVEANGGWWMTTKSGKPGLFVRNPYGKIEAIALATDGIVYKRRLMVDDDIEETVGKVLPDALGKAIASSVR